MTTIIAKVPVTIITNASLAREGWRESANSNRDGHTIYTRPDNDSGRYLIMCRRNSDGAIVAQSSWGTDGNHYQAGYKLFGDRLEAAGLDRRGY